VICFYANGRVCSRNTGQGAGDDFAHVVAQVGLGGHAGDRLARGAAQRLGQLLPAVQRARQARGHLRVDAIELDHALAPEHVAGRVGAVEGAGVGAAVAEDHAARAVRVADVEVRVLHQLLHDRQDVAAAVGAPACSANHLSSTSGSSLNMAWKRCSACARQLVPADTSAASALKRSVMLRRVLEALVGLARPHRVAGGAREAQVRERQAGQGAAAAEDTGSGL
jgi:hypothetical protein